MVRQRSNASRVWVVSLLWLAASTTGLGSGRAANGQTTDAKGNPTVEAVLRKTADFFKKANSVAVDFQRAQKNGEFAIESSFTAALVRPNKFAIRQKADPVGLSLICDGKNVYISISQLKKYTEAPAPAAFDDLQKKPIFGDFMNGLTIAELWSSDPYKGLMTGVKTSKYLGLEQLDGDKVHRLSFTQDLFDWEMYVAATGDPVVKKVTVDLSKVLANQPGQDASKKAQMITTFKNWRIDRDIDAKTFAFQAPQGFQKVASFFEGPAGGEGPPERSLLLGKLAPEVSLKLLDGGDFELKGHRDKQIVMMDFWATWCGPCVKELPILADVAKAYKDKGVVFRAINLQETPDEIREFLKTEKIEITVALDSAGKIGTAYGANTIPMLVLIDKKGIVQAVHIGYSPAIKTTLQKELDALLAGKNLAEEPAGGTAKPKPSAESK